MKKMPICILLLALCLSTAIAAPYQIVCGSAPGEIYFSGLYSQYEGASAFYYSTDSGANISLRDSLDPNMVEMPDYGYFLRDAADSTFLRFRWGNYVEPGQYLTTDGGFSWTPIDTALPSCDIFSSGTITGEIYRRADSPPWFSFAERSINFGQEYSPCRTLGIPDTVTIEDIALGTDSGEVYVWAWQGLLYYSASYADSFSFLGDLLSTWNIPATSKILNGQQPGEIYAFWGYDAFVKYIWRIYNYGANVELMGMFPLSIYWICSPAVSLTAGELYLLALLPDMVPGGIMRIYHTANYGQELDYVRTCSRMAGSRAADRPSA